MQYRNGLQLDLVMMPATQRPGLPPGAMALYDPDGQLAAPWEPAVFHSTRQDVEEWTFLGWIALADIVKYLERGAYWRALEQLHTARGYAWRLWAVARGANYPAFGLTSLLNMPEPALPGDAVSTVPVSLERRALHKAALACADLLEQGSLGAAQTA
ncbi:MAG: hypothetical protein ACREN8_03780, partial [Candidatus Dormibacteraceae bacterium]